MATISDVRVKLIGDSSRLRQAIGKVSDGLRSMANVAKKIAKVASAAFLAIGAAAIAAANTMDKARRKIIVGTGATGKALGELTQIFEEIFVEVPLAAEVIGETLASVQTITGLAGQSLQGLTTQILKMSNLMGGDANTNALQFTRGLQAWQIPAEEGEQLLDKMFKTTQTSGISFEALTKVLQEQQAPLKNLGFGIDGAVDLLGRFSKAGLNARRVMPGLTFAIKLWASENKNAGEELKKAITFIRDSTDKTAALNEAFRIFGADVGLKAFEVIRSGVFTLDDLGKGLDKAGISIDEAAEMSKLFTEEFTKLFRRVQVILAPLGDAFIDAIEEKVIPAIDKWFKQIKDEGPAAFKRFVLGVANLVRAIGPATLGVFNALTASVKALGLAFTATALVMQGMEVAFQLIKSGFDRQAPAVREAQAQWNRIRETGSELKKSFEQDIADIFAAQGPADAVAASIEKLADKFDEIPKKQKAVADEQNKIVQGTMMTVTNVEKMEGRMNAFTDTVKFAGQTIQLGINNNLDQAVLKLRALRIEAERTAQAMAGAGG